MKAPRPDGYQPIFFKSTREITGLARHNFTQKILGGEDTPSVAAEVFLVLIPKEDSPSSTQSFIPLSLCNVSIKVISRMIVNMLKEVLFKLISTIRHPLSPGIKVVTVSSFVKRLFTL